MASSDPVWLQILTLFIMNYVALTDDLASLCLSFSISKMRPINVIIHSFLYYYYFLLNKHFLSVCSGLRTDQRGADHHSHTRSEPCS